VGKEVLIFAAITIGVYIVIYVFEWSWNYVVLSPMILDGKNQAQLKQQAEDIASLNEKLVASSQRQNEIKLRLATLMEREVEIRERLEQKDAELAELVAESDDWVRETIAVLNDSGEFTDAVDFSQVGKLPQSAEQVQKWQHIPDEPRRRQLIRLAMYRKKLDHIRDNRRL
jgi:chromosome segregation ATPase